MVAVAESHQPSPPNLGGNAGWGKSPRPVGRVGERKRTMVWTEAPAGPKYSSSKMSIQTPSSLLVIDFLWGQPSPVDIGHLIVTRCTKGYPKGAGNSASSTLQHRAASRSQAHTLDFSRRRIGGDEWQGRHTLLRLKRTKATSDIFCSRMGHSQGERMMMVNVRCCVQVFAWLMVVSAPECLADTTVWSTNQTICATYTVPTGNTLVVNPGVAVWFGRNGQLVIQGWIEARNAIYTAAFRSPRPPDKPPIPDPCEVMGPPWKGIEMTGNQVSIDLDGVLVQYAERHIDGPAAEHDKKIRNSRLPHAAANRAACIVLYNTSNAYIANNELGAGQNAYYGIQLNRTI